MTIQGNLVTPVGENPDGELAGLKFDAEGNLLVSTNGNGVTDLTNSNISPTGSDIIAQVNYRYFANLSGLTDNRSLIIPAGTVGDIIVLNITVDHALYSFAIKGAAGITLGGGSAATEWSRLFIKNESIKLFANTASNWQIINDGRIPSKVSLTRLAPQEIPNTTTKQILLDTVDLDVGQISDIGNSRLILRRSNIYFITALVYYDSASGLRFFLYVFKDGAVEFGTEVSSYNTGSLACVVATKLLNLAPSEIITLVTFQNSGTPLNISPYSNKRSFLTLVEQL